MCFCVLLSVPSLFFIKGGGVKKANKRKNTPVEPLNFLSGARLVFYSVFLVSDVQTANKREEAERRLGSFDSVCPTSAGLVSRRPPLLLSRMMMWPFQQVVRTQCDCGATFSSAAF